MCFQLDSFGRDRNGARETVDAGTAAGDAADRPGEVISVFGAVRPVDAV